MHAVMLADDDASRLVEARRFVRPVIEDGGVALIIGGPDLVSAFREDPDSKLRDRTITVDAQHCLESVDGPDGLEKPRFRQVIGDLLALAKRRGNGRLAIVGEMVALLWQQGRIGDALVMEQFWSNLLEDEILLCSYPDHLFLGNGASLAKLFYLHSHIHVEEAHAIGYEPPILSLQRAPPAGTAMVRPWVQQDR